jgi:hypothetical protein
MKSANELTENLLNFYSTESYHRHSILFPNLILTDGCLYLAKNAECFWLFDIIGSILRLPQIKKEGFFVAKIKKDEKGATFTADDGDGNILYSQKIEYTDFPLPEYSFYVQYNGEKWAACLKSEY